MVLNTWFDENEHIVKTRDEAIGCYVRTRMDTCTWARPVCTSLRWGEPVFDRASRPVSSQLLAWFVER